MAVKKRLLKKQHSSSNTWNCVILLVFENFLENLGPHLQIHYKQIYTAVDFLRIFLNFL